ncbi:hypothetical protein ACOME3_006071 [Neoechinorhynchus agilis]
MVTSIRLNSKGEILIVRTSCPNPGSSTHLVLPESLKLLPVLVNSLLRSDSLIGAQNVSVDTKAYLLRCLMSMSTPRICQMLYPTLISLLDNDQVDLRCSSKEMSPDRVLLLDNGFEMFIWMGSGVDASIRTQVMAAVNSVMNRDSADGQEAVYQKVKNLLNSRMTAHKKLIKVMIVAEHDSQEIAFKNQMVEEAGFVAGGTSYAEFLLDLHKEIRGISGL